MSWLAGLLRCPAACLAAVSVLGVLGGKGVVQSGHWRRVFTLDVVVVQSFHKEKMSSLVTCTALCGRQDGCLSFGFQPHTGTCLLYDRLVEHTTVGTAAPGTRYYWLLSPRCPTERGYTLEAGICYKFLDNTWVGHAAARERCRQDGAHLLVADPPSVLDRFKSSSYVGTWVGVKEQNHTGGWHWLTGRPVADYGWGQYQPDGTFSNLGCVYIGSNGELDDTECSDQKRPLCQIPLETAGLKFPPSI